LTIKKLGYNVLQSGLQEMV